MLNPIKTYRKARRAANADRIHENQQHLLDLMRLNNADRPEMQLQLDRMQTGINLQRLNSL